MAKVVGDIAIAVGADISPLKREMGKGSKVVKGFGNDTAAMGKRIAKAGAVVATAAAAMGGALLAAGKKAAAAAVEINNMAKIANAGTVEFQKMAAATDTVGISQEKLSDILKDVNDRVGDFVTTGGGPMRDFFEQIAPKVGVTADQFARLSGPEALQLYVTSLEKANLNQQEMTFFMEAMASDSTALLPLLRNNGQAIKTLGDEAQRAGRILDDELIQNGVKLDRVLSDASDTITTSFNRALLENADDIEAIARAISETLIPAASDLLSGIGDIVDAVTKGTGLLGDFFTIATGGEIDEGSGASSPFPPYRDPDTPISSTGNFVIDPETGEIVDAGTEGLGGGGFGSSGGGGGGSSHTLTDDDFEKLQDSFATEAEIIDEKFARDLERLQEFRDAKLGTEEEYNDLEARIRKKHLDDQAALERQAMSARLSIARSIFGGLATLMRSENEKLFKIGKAAAIANSVVAGYEAAVAAWDKGMKIGGPPVAAAFTAGSLLKTGSLIASIQSSTVGGGSSQGTGGSFGGESVAASQQQGPNTLVNVSLQGDSFSQAGVRGLLENINDVIEDGGRIRLV